jgi:hypothetical protein
MRKRHNISLLAVVALALGMARAQDNTAQPASGNSQDSSQQQTTPPPAPAYGQPNQPNAAPIDENPPISGLDQPALGPHSAPISYLQPGVTLSESADSNINETLGGSSLHSISRAIGSLTLRRLWGNYSLALDYAGGAGYYNARNLGWKSLQALAFDQKVSWKRGELSVRDDFSYLPEGNFTASYGSLNSQQGMQQGGLLGGGIFGGAAFGALGQVPRLMNVGAVDVTENLTPKSAITLAGGFGQVHFYGDNNLQAGGGNVLTDTPFIGSYEVSAQGGYDRVIRPHDQVALIYGYQGFSFTVAGTSFHTQVIQLAYGHRVSGRMDITVGAGPQIVNLSVCSVYLGLCQTGTQVADTRLGVAARATVRYHFPKTSFELTYRRMDTNGSGFFAGAETDLGRLEVSRPLDRHWSLFTDLGIARNSRLNPAVDGGVNANTYTFGFAGGGIHRMLGRHFHAFASYQFTELSFDSSLCANLAGCSRASTRNLGTIGLDWIARPIRID